MRIDLHTHAIGHRYSYDGTTPERLSVRDESDIRGLIQWGLERGLDAIGITDHDLTLTGLWAQDYVRAQGLPIRVIPGCECELYYQGCWIHILALNISQPLAYTAFTPPVSLAAQIREQGGVSVLAHPMLYDPKIYQLLKHTLDGMEYRNGAAERRGYPSYADILDEDGYTGLRLFSSDYHYPDKFAEQQWNACTEMDGKLFGRWFGFTSGRQLPQFPPDSRDAAD